MKRNNAVPSFETTADEARLIHLIAKRGVELAAAFGVRWKLLDVNMDITATHANGCALRLADLLAADEANFSHDVGGIIEHLDRTTGKLGGCFLPRFAARQGAR